MKEFKRILNKCGRICLGFFLTPFPSSSPTSVLFCFPILIVEENVYNSLQQCRPVLFGGFPNHPRRKNKLRILKKKLGNPIVHKPQNLEIALREVGHFRDDCATVRRLGDWG